MRHDPVSALRRADPDLYIVRRRIAEHESLDLTYAIIDSPHGSLLLASTPAGLARVAFECEGHDAVLEQLAATLSPRILRDHDRATTIRRQLDEYFEGRRTHFDAALDLQLSKGFRRAVLDQLQRVPYGTTVTYASLAAAAGNAKAVRAAGSACATNPLPIVVPCHRVVRSDSAIGNYLGGTPVKRALLALEAPVPSSA